MTSMFTKYLMKQLLLRIDNESPITFKKPFLNKISRKVQNKCVKNGLIEWDDGMSQYELTDSGIQLVKAALELKRIISYRTPDYTTNGTALYKTPRNKTDIEWVTLNGIISVLFAFTAIILLFVFLHFGFTFWRALLVIVLFFCPDTIYRYELHLWGPKYFKLMRGLK